MKIRKIIYIAFLCSLPLLGRGQSSPLLSNYADYQLVFQDEFSAAALDWNVWQSEDAISTRSDGMKVGRWKENAVLENGLLKLVVKKGNRIDSDWTAGFVYLKQLFGSNTYYESRFRLTNAPGINNAFWTSVQIKSDDATRTFKNRYEIDVLEAKRRDFDNSINGHIAWHDWKTSSYSNSVDIASGYGVNYKTIDFQTWGLWVGEDNFIVYCDGVEQWRGITHPTYTQQWNTGVGKLPVWPTLEEKRAYGKWGQSDWNYMGGMNGDDMNICFSNLPWNDAGSTLTDAANNTSMDIDYLRIYKLKNDLNTVPTQTVAKVNLQESTFITKPIELNTNQNYYFSFVINRPVASNIACDLKSNNQTVISFKISKNNELHLNDGVSDVTTFNSYPATDMPKVYFETGRKYLIVGRITASASGKDIVSVNSFELGESIPSREPFLYRNIDDFGNTSITNEWAINKRINSTNTLNQVVFSDDAQKCQFSDLYFADNYIAVVNNYLNQPCASISGETKSNTDKRIYIDLGGKFPFTVVYTNGKQQTTVSNITQTPYSVAVIPSEVCSYSIVSSTDADGKSAIVGGRANFYVTDVNYTNIRPTFDTYLTEGTTTNSNTAADLLITNKPGSAQETYFSYQLPSNQLSTESANALIYFTIKDVSTPTKIELLGSTQTIDNTTTWNNAPASGAWEVLGSKVLGGTFSYYLDFDITSFCNARFANNQQTFTLKLRQTLGDVNAVTKFKPGHNTTSSVPSYLLVKKSINSALSEPKSIKKSILSYIPSSHLLINSSDELISEVSICTLAGQLLIKTNSLPIDMSKYRNAILIARIACMNHIYLQKLTLF
jgi:hypothetical protein